MRIKDEKTEPTVKRLPEGSLDWTEISAFIEDMLNPRYRGERGWQTIQDASVTGRLQQSSVLVLNMLYDDLYGFFYQQHADKHEAWNRMERYIRTKYGRLSENALSRIITTYHIDDR